MTRAVALPLVVFLVHCVLSLGFNAYDRLSWLDVVMHTAGGVAIAFFIDRVLSHASGLGLLYVEDHAGRTLMVFGLVAAATVFWEFAEFGADTFFNTGAQRSVANTMKDQFFGVVGGTIYLAATRRTTWASPNTDRS